MDRAHLILVITGCVLISCQQSRGQVSPNVTDSTDDDTLPETKERFRRLIPYMTFYLDQGYNTQNQYVTQTPQYQAVDPLQQQAVDPLQQFYMTQQQQQQQYSQPQQLVPVGYLVGGGYRRVPVYSRPTPQNEYTDLPYTQQQSTDFTRMITQNYLAMAKEQVQVQPKDQRPAQYTTKLHYANQLNQQPNHAYKQVLKPRYHQRHRFQSNPRRQPFVVKNTYRPVAAPVKEDSYVQLHSNYDINNETPQKVKNYQPEPSVMTITKSQELKYAVEEDPFPIQLSQPKPTVLKPQEDYEEAAPTAPTVEQSNVLDFLSGYQLTKFLPDKVTPSNIGHSIQTLSNILKLLQKAKAQTSAEITTDDIDGENYNKDVSKDYSPYQTEGSTPGRAGIDYPAYAQIPETHFSCKDQRYKGFFGDPETNCQVWHYCDLNGGQASFLCPNGTIFSQVALTCDWWFNVKCASTAQLYVLNERLYKYILPHKPSFPEDYAGPLVDEYLTAKFQEIEAKKQNKTTTEKPPNTLQVLLEDEVNQAVK